MRFSHGLTYPGFLDLKVYVQDDQTGELRLRVSSTDLSPLLDPQLSPDGCSIAYVRDDEIYVIPTTSGEEIQITCSDRGVDTVNISARLQR